MRYTIKKFGSGKVGRNGWGRLVALARGDGGSTEVGYSPGKAEVGIGVKQSIESPYRHTSVRVTDDGTVLVGYGWTKDGAREDERVVSAPARP